jgi:phospholipid/cholesterol/gamma-HCH transport system substrate-binding protein
MDDRSRTADAKLGLFVLTALTLLILGSLWIAGSTFVGPRRLSYEVAMKGSGGLKPGDRVRVAGVSVGRVQDVLLRPDDEWPVLFEVAVRENVPLRIDGKARITTSGLLGTSFLQIDPGSPSAAVLPEGGRIVGDSAAGFEETLARLDELSSRAVGLLDQVTMTLDQVSTGVDPILANLNRLLSEENVSRVGTLLSTLNGTVSESGPRISSLLARLDGMSASMEDGTERLPEISDKLSALVEDLHTALGPDGSRLAGVLEAAQGSLSSADETLSVLAGNRGRIEATVRDLQETVSNLKSFSQQLKERPFSMVRKVHEPDRRPGQGVEGSRP